MLKNQLLLASGEMIEWQGQPQKTKWIGSGNVKEFFDDEDSYPFIVITCLILFGLFYFFNQIVNNMPPILIEAIILFLIYQFFFHDFLLIRMKKNTYYVITNQRVILQLGFIETSIYEIDFDEIIAVKTTRDENKDQTTVSIFTQKAVKFYTYDFDNRERRNHITLENIEEPEKVRDMLVALVKRHKGIRV